MIPDIKVKSSKRPLLSNEFLSTKVLLLVLLMPFLIMLYAVPYLYTLNNWF